MQSPHPPSAIKVKLSIGIVAIATLFVAMVFSFFSRRTQQPTQPTQEIDLVPLNLAISDLTRAIQDTKLVIEQTQKAQEEQTDIMKSKKEEEDKKLKEEKETTLRQKVFSFKNYDSSKIHQLLVSGIGFFLVIVGFGFTYNQLRANAESLSLTANQNIMSHTLDVDKLFIDSPELRPYFFDGVTPPNKDYNKAAAVAVYELDFFDTFFGQSGDWQVFKNDPAAQDAWMQYFHDSFKHSPIMCVQLKQFANEYTPDFVNLFKGDCREEFGT